MYERMTMTHSVNAATTTIETTKFLPEKRRHDQLNCAPRRLQLPRVQAFTSRRELPLGNCE